MTDQENCLALCKPMSMGNPITEQLCRKTCLGDKLVAPETTVIETPTPKSEKISQLARKLLVINMVRTAIGSIGTVAGFVYANKTGGGFWRYVGFGFMGGFAFGTVGFIASIPAYNKIAKELTELNNKK